MSFGDLVEGAAAIRSRFVSESVRSIGIVADRGALMVEAALACLSGGIPFEISERSALEGVHEFVLTEPHLSFVSPGVLQVLITGSSSFVGSQALYGSITGDIVRALGHAGLTKGSGVNAHDVVLVDGVHDLSDSMGLVLDFLSRGTTVAIPSRQASGDTARLLAFADAEGVSVLGLSRCHLDDITARQLSLPASVRAVIVSDDGVASSAARATA